MAGHPGGRARARARGARHRRDASFRPRDFQAYADRVQGRFFRTLQADRRAPRRRTPTPSSTAPTATGGRAAATGAARRPPLAGGRDHARAGDRARGGRGASRHRAGRRAGRRLAARHLGPRARRAPPQAWLQVESRDSDVPLHERLPGAAGAGSRGCRRRPPATSSSTSRAIRIGAARGSSTCSALSPRTATSRCGRTTARRSAPPSSAGSTGITARLERHPDLHVYHYSAYEPTALKALMPATPRARRRSTTCCAARCSSTSTRSCARRCGSGPRATRSRPSRRCTRSSATPTSRRPAGRSSPTRSTSPPATRRSSRHRRYNEDDCRSTEGLRDWLLAERGERRLPRRGAAEPRRAPSSSPATRRSSASRPRCSRSPATPAGACSPTCSTTTGARRSRSGGRTSTGSGAPPPSCATTTPRRSATSPGRRVPLGEVAQSYLHPLRFPPQEHKLSPGDRSTR